MIVYCAIALCKKLQYVESKYLDNFAEIAIQLFPKNVFTNQIHQIYILAFGHLNADVITLYYKTT